MTWPKLMQDNYNVFHVCNETLDLLNTSDHIAVKKHTLFVGPIVACQSSFVDKCKLETSQLTTVFFF